MKQVVKPILDQGYDLRKHLSMFYYNEQLQGHYGYHFHSSSGLEGALPASTKAFTSCRVFVNL